MPGCALTHWPATPRAPGADTEKLSELALIYGAYESLLAQTAMDPGDRQELAARRLREAGAGADFFSGRAVYIDEFDTFNAPKRALLEAMLPATDLTVSLCCDGLQENDGGVGGVQRGAPSGGYSQGACRTCRH